MIERTLVLLKPDAVERGLSGEIIKRFEQRGLKIIGLKMVVPKREFVEKHYEAHRG
ncbi:MAG: nucleoside-diphosphate kinase, partial [Candidatus Parvarchaeota archaeon]|nr:nucleoside-diphosphate kinase [Candidatus Jingweiarchaeum tengchongense]